LDETRAGHDILIALAGASSPTAFWQHSDKPLLQQSWFYLTLVAATLSVLKPILKWEKNVALFSKLHTRYCDLYMDLKYLTEDMTAEQDVSGKTDSKFTAIRKRFKTLQKDEPPHDKGEIERFQERAI
jgi:hypothetical protein